MLSAEFGIVTGLVRLLAPDWGPISTAAAARLLTGALQATRALFTPVHSA